MVKSENIVDENNSTLNNPNILITPWKIFLEFARLSIMGFGGVLPLAYHSIVERNKWLNDKEFAEMLSIGQMLPGGNIINVSVMLGWRFAKFKGACAAFLGLLLIPTIILLSIAMFYHRISANHTVSSAVIGMSSVVAGLVLATALKLGIKNPNKIKSIIFGIIVFTLIALVHWHLATVLICLIPIALLIEFWFYKKLGAMSNNDI